MPGAILLGAFFLRAWDLGHASLWYDEILEVQIASATPANFIAGLEVNAAMPLDYVIMRFVLTLGTNEFLLRFVAAAASTLAVGAIYSLGRMMFGRTTGLVGAAFLAVSSFAVLYAHEARPYALYTLFVIGSFYAMYCALRTNKFRYWLLFGVCLAGAILSHLFALFVIMLQGLFLVGGLMLRLVAPQRAKLFDRITRTAIIGGVIASVLFLAALWLTPNAQFVWGSALKFFAFLVSPQFLPPSEWTGLAPGETAPLLTWDFVYSRILENFSGGGIFPTASFVGLGLAGLIAFRNKPWEIVVLALWAIVPSALIFIFLGQRGTLFAARYLIASLPPWILLCAVGTAQLAALATRVIRNSRLVQPVVTTAVAVAFIVIAMGPTLLVIPAPKEDWRTAGQILEANVREGDAVIAPGGTNVVFFYAPLSETHANAAQTREPIADAENHAGRVWLVLNRYAYDPGGEITAWLQGRGAVALPADSGISVYYWRAGMETNALLADAMMFQLPPSAYLYTALGDQFAASGDLQRGVNSYAQALRYSQDDSEAATVDAAWGDALRQAGALDAAAEKYRAAVAADSSNVTAWVGLGRVYLEQNQLPAAGDALQRALALNDTFYPALFFVANYYDQTGQAALAQEYYARAGQIIPDLTTPP